MGTPTSSFKIKIVPTIKKSFQIARVNQKILFLYCWLPFLLASIFMFVREYSDYYYDHIAKNLNPLTEDILYSTVFVLLTVPFMLALYRYFIQNKTELKTWNYKRGIEEPKTVLSLIWHYEFGKKELIASIIFLIPILFFTVLNNTSSLMVINKFEGHWTESGFRMAYLINNITINFINDLFFASVILVWPTIALMDNFKPSSIPTLINKLKGNILRIYIIFILLSLPSHIINRLEELTYYFFPQIINHATKFVDVIQMLVYFIILCVEITFISLVYKKINDSEDFNPAQ